MKYNKEQKQVIENIKKIIKTNYPDSRTYIKGKKINSHANELFVRVISNKFEGKSYLENIQSLIELISDVADNSDDLENGFFPCIVEPITHKYVEKQEILK